MKSWNSLFALVLSTVAILLSACSSQPSPDPTPVSTPTVNPVPLIKSIEPWTVTRETSQDGGIQLTRSELSQSEHKRVSALTKKTTFTEIPISPQYNVRLFRLRTPFDPMTLDLGDNVVFLAPKLWMTAGVKSQTAKLLPLVDGTYDVGFPLLFLDPRQTTWSIPNYRTEVDIPESLKAHALPTLMAELQARYGKDVTLAVLPGIAKGAFLKIGEQYVQASSYRPELPKSDRVLDGSPWEVHFRILDADENYLLNTAMTSQSASIEIPYQITLSFPFIKYRLEVSLPSLLEYIQRAAPNRGSGYWCASTVRAITFQAVRSETRKLPIPSSGAASLEVLITNAIDALFDPVSSDSGTPSPISSASCYRLKSSLSQNESQTLRADWEIRSQFPTEQMIRITTPLPQNLN